MRKLVGVAIVWWGVGYLAITVMNGVLTLGVGLLLIDDRGNAAFDVAYQQTVALHMVVGALVWTVTGWCVWRRVDPVRRAAAAAVSLLWLVLALIVDAVIFVWLLGDTPAGAPPETFYLHNQPWTALYYLAVVLGPVLALALVHRGHGDRSEPPSPREERQRWVARQEADISTRLYPKDGPTALPVDSED